MSIYDITIAGVGGSAPSDGFIDYKTVYVYMNASNGSDAPSTLAKATAKARANRRHKSVVTSLINYGALTITTITATGSPNCDTAPSTMVYRLEGDIARVSTPDEANSGQTLTGMAAVKRIVARALLKAETVGLEVFDPTTSTAPGNSTLYNRTGPRFFEAVVGALYTVRATAEASITVALVS